MKKIITLFTFLFVFNMLSCQKNNKVPDEVQKSFEAKYPGENDPDWRTDRNDNFEAHFKQDDKHYRADFTPQGKWIETERSIKKKELPELVLEKLKLEYDDYEIVELEETRHHSKGLFYDVELKKDGKKQDVEFNVNGKILN